MPWPDPPSDLVLPPFACVPGKTDRHPEDWFDPIKASVSDDASPRDLHHTKAFKAGLAYFESGYFWECHEVLEAVWLRTIKNSPERELVQALIQLANARLKLRMGKPRAAARLCDMVSAHLAKCGAENDIFGLGISEVEDRLRHTRILADME